MLFYVCMPTFIATIAVPKCTGVPTGPVIGIFIWIDCLRLFVVVYKLNTVYNMFLIMYCMCLPAFFIAGADKSQLWVYTYVYAIY